MISDPVYWVSFTQTCNTKKVDTIFRFNTLTYTVLENRAKTVAALKEHLIGKAKDKLSIWYTSHGYKNKTKKNSDELIFIDKNIIVTIKNFKVKKVESSL